MGLLIDEHQPVIWRGPMLNGIIRQFLYQAEWGERDVLVVDLLPGTGDAQLAAQAVPMQALSSSPHPSRSLCRMPAAAWRCSVRWGSPSSSCGEHELLYPSDLPERSYALFGSGGGATLAADYGVPLLAQIPMEMPIQEGGDSADRSCCLAPTPPAQPLQPGRCGDSTGRITRVTMRACASSAATPGMDSLGVPLAMVGIAGLPIASTQRQADYADWYHHWITAAVGAAIALALERLPLQRLRRCFCRFTEPRFSA